MKQEQHALFSTPDDVGHTEARTRPIYEALQKGLITDTTMVANGEAMELAFAMAPEMRGHIGAHLNLTEGPALTPAMRKNAKFVSNGRFTDYFKTRSNYFRRLSPQDKQDIYEELTAQMERLIAGGIELTHADSHHHIHWNWMLAPIFFRVCREHGICRVRCHKNVRGRFKLWNGLYAHIYGIRLRQNGFRSPEHFESIRMYEKTLPGISEMMVHPDHDSDGVLIDREKKEHLPDGKVAARGKALEPLVRSRAGSVQKMEYARL